VNGGFAVVQFYVPITSCVSVVNPQVIPFLLQMRWFGQRAGSEIHLEVSHPRSDGRHELVERTKFHKLLWDDVDDSEGAAFRMGRLRLEGNRENKKVFAIVWLNIDRPDLLCSIIFSPVPFGPDGKAILPYTGDKLEMFFQVARLVLFGGLRTIWTDESLTRELHIHKTMNIPEHEFDSSNAWFWLGELEKIALVKCCAGEKRSYASVMTSSRFQEVFGIELPRVRGYR